MGTTLFLRIRQKVPLRIAEWLGASGMMMVGGFLIIWPAAFDRAGLAGFSAIAPAWIWIGASILLGVVRVGALFLNGHKAEVSAPIRCLGAIAGVGFYSSLAAGYSLAPLEGGPPLATGLSLVLLAGDVFSTFRSAGDTFDALKNKKDAAKWVGFSR